MQGRSTVNPSLTGLRIAALIFYLALTGMTALWAPPAAAVEAVGLYRVTLPVADRSQDVLDAAFQQALSLVLVKVSGDSQVITQPAIQQALQNPSTYVQQFLYQQAPPSGTTAPAQPDVNLKLQVRFDPIAINHLLTANGLPLWGRERPLVILWVGINRGNGQRFILSSESDTPHTHATQAVEQEAQARGLPIFLPLMDLQDHAAVSFSDLSGGFITPLLQASARYEANAVLAGVAQPVGGQWVGQWQLEFRGHTEQWSSAGLDQEQALAGAISGAADRLAQMLAVSTGTATGQAMYVQVNGVSDIASYARIERLLNKLTPIKSEQLVSADAGQVVFRVVPRGQAGDVARNLGLVGWLQAMQSTAGATQSADAGQTLYFNYVP